MLVLVTMSTGSKKVVPSGLAAPRALPGEGGFDGAPAACLDIRDGGVRSVAGPVGAGGRATFGVGLEGARPPGWAGGAPVGGGALVRPPVPGAGAEPVAFAGPLPAACAGCPTTGRYRLTGRSVARYVPRRWLPLPAALVAQTVDLALHLVELAFELVNVAGL